MTKTNDHSSPARGKGVDPLYMQVADALRQDIVDGVYTMGGQLPAEDVLRERFGVSRFTVREAIRRLREEGLVSSRRGVGTIVTPTGGTGSDVMHATSINDLVTFATDTRLTIEMIKLIKVDAKLAARIGVVKNEEWLAVTGVRRAIANDAPVCWVEYYINRDYATVGRLLPRHNGAIFTLIEDIFAVSIWEVQQEITATAIPAELADKLEEQVGAPALQVRRTYKVIDEKVAQITVNTHPASRFSHMMTMRRVKF